MLKEALVLDEMETEMLADLFKFRSIKAALTVNDSGAQSQTFFMEYGKIQFPWVYEGDIDKVVQESSIPGLSPSEATEAERLIKMLRQVQEQDKKDKK